MRCWSNARGGRQFRRNVEEYELDLGTLVWRRTTGRDWPQFTIRPTDRKWFDLDHRPDFEVFRPTGVPHEVLPPVDWNSYQLLIHGVTVRFIVGGREVEILIEGTLPSDTATELARRPAGTPKQRSAASAWWMRCE